MAETVDPGSDEYDSDLEAEVDDIMYWVFGECESAEGESECDESGSTNYTDDQLSEEDIDIDDIGM